MPKVLSLVPKEEKSNEELAEYFEEFAAKARAGKIDIAAVAALSNDGYTCSSMFCSDADIFILIGGMEYLKRTALKDFWLEECEEETE